MVAPGVWDGTSDRRIANTRDGKPVWIRPRRGVREGAPAARDHCSKPSCKAKPQVGRPHSWSRWKIGCVRQMMALIGHPGCARGVQPRHSTARRLWALVRSIPRTSSPEPSPPTGSTSIPMRSPRWPIQRAVRRIDPCGCLTRDAMAKIGEIGSVGTLFAFDECDVDIKMPGEADRRYVSIEVIFYRLAGQPVAFLAGDLPVYETYPGSCGYLLPLNLSLLPGALPLRQPDQPFVRVGLIAEENCDFAQRLSRAIASTVEPLQLPVRDAVAVYPNTFAERDPCQVLSVLAGEVESWDVTRSRPYECHLRDLARRDVVPITAVAGTEDVRHGDRDHGAPRTRRRRASRRPDVLLGGGVRRRPDAAQAARRRLRRHRRGRHPARGGGGQRR